MRGIGRIYAPPMARVHDLIQTCRVACPREYPLQHSLPVGVMVLILITHALLPCRTRLRPYLLQCLREAFLVPNLLLQDTLHAVYVFVESLRPGSAGARLARAASFSP